MFWGLVLTVLGGFGGLLFLGGIRGVWFWLEQNLGGFGILGFWCSRVVLGLMNLVTLITFSLPRPGICWFCFGVLCL